MKRTVAIMLLTATMVTGQLLAQEQATPKQSHNSVYLEFGGNAPIWNIAYDRVISNLPRANAKINKNSYSSSI